VYRDLSRALSRSKRKLGSGPAISFNRVPLRARKQDVSLVRNQIYDRQRLNSLMRADREGGKHLPDRALAWRTLGRQTIPTNGRRARKLQIVSRNETSRHATKMDRTKLRELLVPLLPSLLSIPVTISCDVSPRESAVFFRGSIFLSLRLGVSLCLFYEFDLLFDLDDARICARKRGILNSESLTIVIIRDEQHRAKKTQNERNVGTSRVLSLRLFFRPNRRTGPDFRGLR
jgi:hypothetical protein